MIFQFTVLLILKLVASLPRDKLINGSAAIRVNTPFSQCKAHKKYVYKRVTKKKYKIFFNNNDNNK